MYRKYLPNVRNCLLSQRAPSAEASDLGALPFGRRSQPPLSCNPLLNHARTLTRSETERRFTFPSRLATKTGNSYDLIDSIGHARISWGLV